jgi:hypothetical protein
MRISVEMILELIAKGATQDEILEDTPNSYLRMRARRCSTNKAGFDVAQVSSASRLATRP